MPDKSRFIVFEGGEGCGKSTQAALLARAIDARLTREPGGTVLGERIREVLLHAQDHGFDARAELFLLVAARAQHVEEVIIPTLRAGQHVVCDRFSGSTLAYQSFGRGLPIEDVVVANEIATNGIHPDLTILLDVSLSLAKARRGAVSDRIEAAGEEFHERVAAGFLEIAQSDPEHWAVLDGGMSADEVAASVREVVLERLGLKVPAR